MAFLTVNAYVRLTTTSYWQKNQNVLTNPLSSKEHVVLAQNAWTNNDWQKAKNELLVAQVLLKNTGEAAATNVLGVAAAPQDLLHQWEREPAVLTDEEHFWQTVVAQKTDYRDAFIRLSAINYELNNDQKAASYLDTARALDPNFIYVKKLSELLKASGK